ncbi:hypothetical protein GCM10025771_13030 [Niveibacterium umoris]|uniref:Uncharacterized protein n=1 Tax=Niveibacterium umoris TaxID=1193620 RepID=A0A840BHW6_9RHOO|nr:hypothetical protein [Niveibacterium umoris]MBB4013141.1 hypothetical protein [Niveibacterium umoris]
MKKSFTQLATPLAPSLMVSAMLTCGLAEATDVAPHLYPWGIGNAAYRTNAFAAEKSNAVSGATFVSVMAGNGCVAITNDASYAITGATKSDATTSGQAGISASPWVPMASPLRPLASQTRWRSRWAR